LALARSGAIACFAVLALAGCGGKTQTAATATTNSPVLTTPQPPAALTTGIKRRLEAAGYAVYARGPFDPFPDAALYVEVDWATPHTFKFWIVPFASTRDAVAFFEPAYRERKRFARSLRAAREGRVVYLASTAQEDFGGKVETAALPVADFQAILALAEGRR
jgi:hypothetical protein